MNTAAKVLVTIGILVLWLLASAVNTKMRRDSGHSTPGFFGFIIIAATIGAIRAVWRRNKNDGRSDNSDSSVLQK